MFMLWLDYPSFAEEVEILKRTTTAKQEQVRQILTAEDILAIQSLIKDIPVSDNVYQYAVRLVSKTRLNKSDNTTAKQYLSWGAGPRASQYLIIGAKCHAALNGKYSPDIEDVNAVAVSVLRHRIVLNYAAQAEELTSEAIINKLINE